MKRVLIINAGIKQLPMLRWAKQKGYQVLVADSRPDMLCFPEADVVLPIAPFHEDALVEAAKANEIDAVAYTTSENPIPVVRRIAHQLGLPCNLTDEAASASCDKLAMRRLFSRAGIDDCPWRGVESIAEVKAFCAVVGFPVVLKPRGFGNQIGLFIVQDESDLIAQSVKIESALTRSKYLIERLYNGHELNAVALFVEGELYMHTLSDRLHYGAEYKFIVHEHRYPSNESPQILEKARAKSLAIGKALRVKNAIVFIQYIVTSGEVRTVEIGVRVPGGMMWQLFRCATGVDLMETWLEMNVNAGYCPLDVQRRDSYPAVCIRFLSSSPGPLQVGNLLAIHGRDRVLAVPGVKDAGLYNKFCTGMLPREIPALRDGSDRFFYVVTVGETYEDARARNLEASGLLEFIVEPLKGITE